MNLSEEQRIKLGFWVKSIFRLKRRSHWDGRVLRKSWQVVAEPVSGIYIGWRTYSDGKVISGYDGPVFYPESYGKVALIVEDERKAPIPVPFENMRRVNQCT